MRKLLWLWFLLASFAFSQTTPNIGLNIPNYGTLNWNVQMNNNFSALDLMLSGNQSIPGLNVAGALTLSGLTGTSCIQQSSGVLSSTGNPCSQPYYGIPISYYGTSDFCVSWQAAKTANPLGTLNGGGFNGTLPTTPITCSTSGYVAGFYGQTYLPFGTIYAQTPILLQTHSDVHGQGEDSTIIKACTGQSYCGSITFPSNEPLVAWSDNGNDWNYTANPTFDTRLYNVGLDGSSVSGIIDLANCVAQENESGPHQVSMHGWGNGGIGYLWGCANLNTSNGPGSQNHEVSGLDIYLANGETSTTSALGILGNTGVIGEAGPKQLANVTITANSGIVGTKPNVLADIKDGTGTIINALHMENAGQYGLELGDGAGVKGFDLHNVNGGNMTGATALVYLSNVANSSSISMSDTDTVGPNFPTYVIDDQLTGCLIPAATESAAARYDLGAPDSIVGGLSRISSSGVAGCQTIQEYLTYHLDDPGHCYTYNTGGTEQCTNGSLTNPSSGQPFIVTAFPPNVTSITVIDNAIGPKTAPVVEPAPWASTSAYLNIGCASTASFNPYTNGLAVTGITPYVAGSQLGELTVTLNSAYVSGPVCVVIYLRGFDQ